MAAINDNSALQVREAREQSGNPRGAGAQEGAQQDVITYLYRHLDKDGLLLYVGISLSAIKRMEQHRDGSHWFVDICRIEIETHPSRAAALKAERQAITTENPVHNIRRPKPQEQEAFRQQIAAEESSRDLVRRLVQFNPLYDLQGAAKALGISTGLLNRVIASGKIGTVRVGDARVRITGWQIIEYLEAAQRGIA